MSAFNLTLAVMLAVASGCSEPVETVTAPIAASAVQDIRVAFGQEFALSNGQTALVGNDGLLVRFDQVTSDERCPVGDTCASQGDAVLLITMRQSPHPPASLELHTDPERSIEGEYLGYRVRVVRLEPRPVGEQPVPLARYVATLRVSN
jgi:hypothetical protein